MPSEKKVTSHARTASFTSSSLAKCRPLKASLSGPNKWQIGKLAMMGWDWRLRTAASTGLLFILGWFAMWTMVWYWLRLTPNLSTRALWQPPVLSGDSRSAETSLAALSTGWRFCHQRRLWKPRVLSGGPAIRDISGASGRMGEGNENLVYSSPWDFKRSFTCRKVLREGTSGFTFHPKEGVLRIFIVLKNPSLGRVRTRNLWVQWQAH
jgi:hypothetical protein